MTDYTPFIWKDNQSGNTPLNAENLNRLENIIAVLASLNSELPTAPSDLTAEVTADSATLSWDQPASVGGSPISGYKYGRFGYDANGGGPWVSDLLPANTRTAPLNSLIPGSTYAGVWVAAVNDFGTGPKAKLDITLKNSGPAGNIFPPEIYDAGNDLTQFGVDGLGVTLANSTAWSTVGGSSVEVTIGSTATNTSGVRPSSNVEAVAGRTYKFEVDIQNVSVTTKFRPTFKWRKADGTSLQVDTGAVVTIPVGSTQRISVTATAPAGTSFVYPPVRFADDTQTPIAGQKFRLDGWTLTDVTPTTTPPATGNLISSAAADAGSNLNAFIARGSSGGTVLEVSNEWAAVGSTSIKSTFNSGASRGSGPFIAEYVPATDGIYYKATAQVRNGNSTQKFQIYFEWSDSNKVAISGSPDGNPTTINSGATATLSTEVTAPPKAAFVRFGIKNDTTTRPTAGSYYYVDDLKLITTSTVAKTDTYQWVISDRKRPGAIFTTPSSYWKVDVTNAPLHGNSATLINTLITNDITPNYSGITVFNTSQYNSTNYTVSGSHPRINIGFCDAQRKGYTPGELYADTSYKAFRDVPVPRGAVNGGGGDGHITIHCPDTDQLWEFWQFQEDRQQDSGYGGVQPEDAAAGRYGYKTAAQVAKSWKGFSATWGGRIDNVSASTGVFPGATGTSASGLSYADGTISFSDLAAGVIDHALAISIVSPRSGVFSFPARRTDGYVNSVNNIPEGLRLKMDPTIDFDTQYQSLHPLARMVAKALQKYGGIVTDKSGGVEVEGESSSAIQRRGGASPWPTYLAGVPDYNVMKGFPWSKMQALPFDYLKP